MHKLLLFLFALLLPITANAVTCSAGYYSLLPSGYTELEYIESTGTQYIDTGTMIVPMRLEITAQTAENGGDGIVAGYNVHGGFYIQAINSEQLGWSLIEPRHVPLVSTNIYVKSDLVYELQPDQAILSVDGVVVQSNVPDPGEYPTSQDNFFLAAIKYLGVPDYYFRGRIYGARMYNGSNELIRYFVPARRESDSVLGMLDLVSGTFFTNDGTGTFVAGADTGTCVECTNKPAHSHYSGSGGPTNSCPWQCDDGYWNDNGTCTLCPRGNNLAPATYCPGDGTKHNCPTTPANYDYYAATGYHNVTNDPDADAKFRSVMLSPNAAELILGEASWNSGSASAAQLASVTSACGGRLIMSDDNGNLFLSEGYWNGENYYYSGSKWWFYSAPGYYRSTRNIVTWNESYKNVLPCTNTPPTHAHFTEWTEPNNPNCAWECDAGYGLYNGVCHARCPYGDGELHVGQYTHPLWADITNVPSPSVYIGELGPNHDGLCYAYLEPDDTPVDNHHGFHTVHNGVPYHAINLGLYGLE